MKKRVATLTMNPAVDVSTAIPRMQAGRKLRCEAPRRDPGGGGINVARGLRRLGGDASALFPAGGPVGRHLGELLDREGITTVHVPIEGETRESFTVTDRSDGQVYRYILPGPRLSETEWRRCLDQLRGIEPTPRYIVASGSLPTGVPEDFYAHVARVSHELGSRLILDSSGLAMQAALDEGVHLVRGNFAEFQEYTGKALEDPREQEEAMLELVERGYADVVILTLGPYGALLTSREGHIRMRAPKVQVVNPSGAGDSFVAGLTCHLAQDKPYDVALRYAVAAASAVMLTEGTELFRHEDVERLYEAVVAD